MRTLGIVQARMGSTRLPGKVLRQLAGRTVLGRVTRAVVASEAVDEVIVATTTDRIDDAIAAECGRLGVACHRGPVDDVLTRFIEVVKNHSADAVARFTADCPLLDPELVALGVSVFRSVPALDYLTTSIHRTLPRGLDVEVVSADALLELDRVATGFHRTHVTSYAWSHPHAFRVLGLTLQPSYEQLRVTLDTPEDWRLMQAVVDHFGDSVVPWRVLAEWLSTHPEVASLNASVTQKELAAG